MGVVAHFSISECTHSPSPWCLLAWREQAKSSRCRLDYAGMRPTLTPTSIWCSNRVSWPVVSSWEGSDVPSWDAQLSWANEVVRAEYFPTLNLEHNGEPIALPRSTGAVPFISDLGYEAQLRSLLDDMNNRATPFMDVRFGRWILEIVCAAYVSAASDGQSTSVPSGCDRRRTPLDMWKNPPSTS